MYHFIETGLRHPENTDMVFAAIYSDPGTPGPHINVPRTQRGQVPLVVMLLRWDGFIGFPGGRVEPGEDLLTALRRELFEEIACEKEYRNATLEPLCSLATDAGDRHIHCYEYKLECDKCIQRVIHRAPLARGFLKEVQGAFAVQVAHFESGGGIMDFLQNKFRATAKMELEHLIRTYKWLPL